MAVQGPVIRWVSDHRKHHSFADREGDPHSPHAGFAPGIRGKIAGLWHAHVGWLFRNVGRAEWTKYAKDLLADRGMVFISRMFPLWVARLADRCRSPPAGSGAARSAPACRRCSGAA